MSWDWELVRLLSAFAAGMVISHCGSLIQLTSRNEMASPSTLGMDGLAVALVLLFYLLQNFFDLDLSLEQLGLIGVFLIGGILRLVPSRWLPYHGSRGEDFRFILLLGLSVNLLIGAVFAGLQFLAMAFAREFPNQLWFGRVQTFGATQLGGSVLLLTILGITAFRHRGRWKALLLGPGWCYGLGVPLQLIMKDALWIAFIGNLWVITQFGVFSFLGLLFPILLRQLPRYHARPWLELTEGALLAGGLFALLDHLCFNLTFHGAEIPVGLPAAMLGSLSLVILLWKRFLNQNSLAKTP